jgi:hypothetical protein
MVSGDSVLALPSGTRSAALRGLLQGKATQA